MRFPLLAAAVVLLAVPAHAAKAKPKAKAAAPEAAAPELPAVLKSTKAPVTVADVVALFEAIDREIAGLSGRFTQAVNLSESGVRQEVEGTLEMRKPDRFRIEHARPEKQTVVSDGKAVWIHRHSQHQVIHSELADWRKSDPLVNRLLDFGAYADMLKKYDVSYSSATLDVFLTPKSKDGEGSFTLRLRLSGPGWFPAETELVVAQMKVRTSLSDLAFNPKTDDKRFAFTPPPGTDVFRNFKPPRLDQ